MNKDISDFDGADIIDMRDVTKRFAELRDERDWVAEELADATKALVEFDKHDPEQVFEDLQEALADAEKGLADWYEENREELVKLQTLIDELSGYGGNHKFEGTWYPDQLINDSHFEEAMDELLEEIGDLPKDLPDYLTVTVDYSALQQDYSSVEFEGTAYFEVRNASIRETARAQTGAHEVYDDAHVDEVDDGYWVTAKIFVAKEAK